MCHTQATPGLTLACPTPTSTGVTLDVSTAAGAWEIQLPGGAWAPALAANNPNWQPVPGAAWIGDDVTGPQGNISYRVALDASDPNIDLASATLSFSYRADNTMLTGTLGGTSLTVTPSAAHNAPAAFDGTAGTSTPLTAGSNALLMVVENEFGTDTPYGLAMQATLTFDCRAVTPPAAVPANAPWALITLSGLMLAGVAAVRRRKRG